MLINKDSTGSKVLPCKINSKMADHLAKALLDPDMMIGVFEKFQIGHRLIHLKSGIIPEMDKNYLEDVIPLALIKLGTQTVIKGDFDSLIFIKYPITVYDKKNDFKNNPKINLGTTWLLLLEKAFTNSGTAKADWAGKLNSKNRKIYNEKTIFLNAFDTNYGLCYKWSNEAKPSELILVDENFINDLVSISGILELKKKEREIELLKKLEENECSSECGKLMMKKIILTLSQASK
jgi:hypothetical protein